MSVNPSPQQHEMQLLATHSSGAKEWYCPTCGRRFLLQFPPNYQKIVLEAGDEYALHSGGEGGLKMGVNNISQEGEPADEKHLTPWKEWLDNVDFESWWGQDTP